MDQIVKFIRARITSTALSAATALMILKLVLPSIFDFLVDMMVLLLIWVVGAVKDDPNHPPK